LSRNGVARGAEARITGGGGFNSLLESAAPGDVFVVFIDEITRTNFRGEKITLPSFKSSFTIRVK